MTISATRAKEIFQSLYLHFTSDKYDFHRYRGKVKAVRLKEGTKEWHQFALLGTKFETEEELSDFFLANMFVYHDRNEQWPYHIGEIYSKDMSNIWVSWKTYAVGSNLIDSTIKDIEASGKTTKELIAVDNGQIPSIIREVLKHKISPLSVAAISSIIPGLFDYWGKNCTEPFLVPREVKFYQKLAQFIMMSDADKARLKTFVMNDVDKSNTSVTNESNV